MAGIAVDYESANYWHAGCRQPVVVPSLWGAPHVHGWLSVGEASNPRIDQSDLERFTSRPA